MEQMWRHCRERPFRRGGLLFFLVWLLGRAATISPAAAQPPATAYWEYAAPGRLQQILPADLNGDGVDEIIIATESGQIDLLSADGFTQWRYETGEAVLALNAARLPAPEGEGTERAIVAGLRDRLLVLNADGTVRWRRPLSPLTVPPALLTGGSEATARAWLARYDALPVAVSPFDQDGDGVDEILLLLRSGQPQLFAGDGTLLWRYPYNDNPSIDTQARMTVADLDGDGQSEAVFGYFNPGRRFSRLVMLESDMSVAWDAPFSGRLTALTLVPFSEPAIAVGNSLGYVNLYGIDGQRLWPRTLNKPVTALTAVSLRDETLLAAGTEVGAVTLFTRAGQRRWTAYLAPEADRRVISLSASPARVPQERPIPALAAVVGPPDGASGLTDVFLLDGNSRSLRTITDVEPRGLSRLTDVNDDGHSELLLARFPNVALRGLGIGASENAREWSRLLRAEPRASLVVDFNRDGEDELLIGAADGRLHRFQNDGSLQWRAAPGGEITHLATLETGATKAPYVVAGRVETQGETTESWLELRRDNGERIWRQPLPAPLTALHVADFEDLGEAEIIAGTAAGDVAVYAATGARLWHDQIEEPVRHLLVVNGRDPQYPDRRELIVADSQALYKAPEGGSALRRIASFPAPIVELYAVEQPGRELSIRFLVLVGDGSIHGLNWRGIRLPPWPVRLDGAPTVSLLAPETAEEIFDFTENRAMSFLIATDQGSLYQFHLENNIPSFSWRIRGVGEISALHWGDVDGDSLPDVALSKRGEGVWVFNQDLDAQNLDTSAELQLGSDAFALTALRRNAELESDLLVVSENGVVQLFRAQENRPPLLTNPSVDVGAGQYNATVFVRDVENDPVQVRLDVQDPDTGRWLVQEERELGNGNGQLSFSVGNPPGRDAPVRYRFFYQDTFHTGFLTPPPGPAPLVSPWSNASRIALVVLTGLLLVTAVILLRQTQTPAPRARRFHRRLGQNPTQTLPMLERKYLYTGGSPDFLLYLAGQARQRGDWRVAGLADGLFLLADRPLAAISILLGVLDKTTSHTPPWEDLERWQLTFRTGQALLEAPSITELSLLRPQLVQLLTYLEESEAWSPTLDTLLPVLTNLRDSERVELVEDRLVYLNEAVSLLDLIQQQLPEFSERMEKTLVAAIIRRWSGMIGAKMEELRGQAELVVQLKTKRLAPNGEAQVALEIHNQGRAAAEGITAVLADNPAYQVASPPQEVPFIPPGRSRQIRFAIKPQVKDRFRVALTLTYNDRNRQGKTTAFGDMVHLLPPARDFQPIPNPYIPGSPLRRSSTLFYGREELFTFIAENAGDWSQRNVLILVGQRRTGKTSALLQLEYHLPPQMIPVYIDCQSLGVVPGMPAFLHEIAWQITDALLPREVEVDVPPLAEWETDPTGHFQRKFLPYVQASLPEGTTLMLVFDEFEALESLVQDQILPSTLFPYLRHLMQHSTGLSFIFVGTRRLEEMSADYWSVLFNIALYRKIGYLGAEAATRLITEPVSPAIVYDDLALDKILRVTAGHPYFLQLVCYTLVKRANAQGTGYVTISDVNAALDEMLRLGEMHFAYMWQGSTATERAILTAVAHLMDPDFPFHPEELIQALDPYGITPDPAQVTAALTSLVERDILREVTEAAKTVYEVRIGLVTLWVAKNKSLSKLLYAEENGKQVAAQG